MSEQLSQEPEGQAPSGSAEVQAEEDGGKNVIEEFQSLRQIRDSLTGEDKQREAELNENISRLLSESTSKITEKLRSGEELSERERLLLLHDIDERAERSAIAEMLLQRNGFKTFQEVLGKLNVKSVDVDKLTVVLEKQHKNPWVKEHIKKLASSGAISAATLGIISLLGGPISLAGLAGGVVLGAGGRLVGEVIRHRQLAKDGFNDKVATDLLGEVHLMQTEAKKILENASDDPSERAKAINSLLRGTLQKEKLNSVVNYQKLEKRASFIKSGLGLIGAVGGSLVGSALTRSADVVHALQEAKTEGVRIVHENGAAHLALDPSQGHEVYQTNDGVWRFMIEKKDVISAQERLGSDHWREWFHVVSQGGPEQGIVRAPDLQALHAITGEAGKSGLFHLSEIDTSSVQAAIGENVTYQTMLTLAGMGGAAAASEGAFLWQESRKPTKQEIRIDDAALLEVKEGEDQEVESKDKEKPPKESEWHDSAGKVVTDLEKFYELSSIPETDMTEDDRQYLSQLKEKMGSFFTDPATGKLYGDRRWTYILDYISELSHNHPSLQRQFKELGSFLQTHIIYPLAEGRFFTADSPGQQPQDVTEEKAPQPDKTDPLEDKNKAEKEARPNYAFGVTEVVSDLVNDSAGADNMVLRPDQGLYGVFDGLGRTGAPAADLASKTFEHMLDNLDPDLTAEQVEEKMKETFIKANEAIRLDAGESKTTASVVRLWQEPGSDEVKAVIGNIGDSRVYIFRADTGKLESITLDDGVFNYTDFEKTDRGVRATGPLRSEEESRKIQTLMSRAYSEYDPSLGDFKKFYSVQNVMHKGLGFETSCEPQIYTLPLASNDRLLICSDGIHEALSETLVEWLFARYTDQTNLAFDARGFKEAVTQLIIQPLDNIPQEFNKKVDDDRSFIVLDRNQDTLSPNYKQMRLEEISSPILNQLQEINRRERAREKWLAKAEERRVSGSSSSSAYYQGLAESDTSKIGIELEGLEKSVNSQRDNPEFMENLKTAIELIARQANREQFFNDLKPRLGL